jgi:hypothetical protein
MREVWQDDHLGHTVFVGVVRMFIKLSLVRQLDEKELTVMGSYRTRKDDTRFCLEKNYIISFVQVARAGKSYMFGKSILHHSESRSIELRISYEAPRVVMQYATTCRPVHFYPLV